MNNSSVIPRCETKVFHVLLFSEHVSFFSFGLKVLHASLLGTDQSNTWTLLPAERSFARSFSTIRGRPWRRRHLEGSIWRSEASKSLQH